MEYYSAIKKKNILPFMTVWMDLENIMLSETSQSEKDKYHVISLVWNLMNKLNSQAIWRQSHREQDDSFGGVEQKGNRTHGRGQQGGGR